MRRGIIITLLLGATLPAIPGCGDACNELQTVCDRCSDPNHRAACEASVDEGVQDTCEQNIDSYGNVCR